MEEIWKDITDYEGLYQVSNLGNVKSLRYRNTAKEHELKQKIRKGSNYKCVALSKKGVVKDFYVHKLVAETFIPKVNIKTHTVDEIKMDKLCINHIDENKHNNCVTNLEWCTHRYNDNYGYRIPNLKQKLKGNDNRKKSNIFPFTSQHI